MAAKRCVQESEIFGSKDQGINDIIEKDYLNLG